MKQGAKIEWGFLFIVTVQNGRTFVRLRISQFDFHRPWVGCNIFSPAQRWWLTAPWCIIPSRYIFCGLDVVAIEVHAEWRHFPSLKDFSIFIVKTKISWKSYVQYLWNRLEFAHSLVYLTLAHWVLDEFQLMFGQSVLAHFLVRVNYSRPKSKYIFQVLGYNQNRFLSLSFEMFDSNSGIFNGSKYKWHPFGDSRLPLCLPVCVDYYSMFSVLIWCHS